jgi:predicted phage terminase large subunit-like protein
VIQELRRLTELVVFEVVPKDDKVTRCHAVSDMVRNGVVYVLGRKDAESGLRSKTEPALSAAMVIQEIAEFPAGEHDDLVDSTTQALHHLRNQGFEIYDSEVRVQPLEPLQSPFKVA